MTEIFLSSVKKNYRRKLAVELTNNHLKVDISEYRYPARSILKRTELYLRVILLFAALMLAALPQKNIAADY